MVDDLSKSVEVGVDTDTKTADELRMEIEHPDEADGVGVGVVTVHGRTEDGPEFSREYDLVMRRRRDGTERMSVPFEIVDVSDIQRYIGNDRRVDPDRVAVVRVTAPNTVEFFVTDE